MLLSRHLFCLVLPAVIVLAGHFAGFWILLGAHPWWSLSGADIGIAIGLATMVLLAFLSRFGKVSPLLLLLGFSALALVAAILMLNGKESFAMSYARDAVAGRFWYFGYIGFIAAVYATLAAGCEAFITRHG